jgi:hypothetical protein
VKCPLDFISLCIEEYKDAYKLSGREVISLFKRHNILSYLEDCYEILHIEGGLAIAERIKRVIETGFDRETPGEKY